MTKLVKTSPKLSYGTCLQGYVETSYANLVKQFGPPSMLDSGDGKVRAEWVLTPVGEKVPITIYDWKDSTPIKQVTDWHVGGKSPLAVHLLHEIFPQTRPAR